MIFENCYKTLSPANRNSSTYGGIRSIGKFLRDMEIIYNAKVINGPSALSNSNRKLLNGGSSVGGQAFNRYSTGYDANLTYYIVIDLELYPGDSISMQMKASIACQLRYEKIRQSYADLFGLVYQPKELTMSEDSNKKYLARQNNTRKENMNKNKKTRRR